MVSLLFFTKKYWDNVGDVVSKAYLEVLNGGGEINAINETLVTLISKKEQLMRVEDYWPISFCNVVYEIITKAIAN